MNTQTSIKGIGHYFKTHYRIYLYALIFAFFSFGFMLTHFQINIDEETWLLETYDTPRWLLQSRYGIYLFNLFFTHDGRFVPFFTDVVAICFWCLSGFIFLYVFKDFFKSQFWFNVALVAYYCTIPLTVGEMFSFSMMVLPETIGMCCASIAFLLTVQPLVKKRWINSTIIAVLLIYATGCYQALLGCYISAIAGICLLKEMNQLSWKKDFLYGFIFTLIGIIGYYLIDKILVWLLDAGEYLSGAYIGWNSGLSVVDVLRKPLSDIFYFTFGTSQSGTSLVGSIVLKILIITFLVCSLINIIHISGWKAKVTLTLLTLGLIISPFILTIALGSQNLAGRMLLAFSVTGMIELICIDYCFKNHVYHILVLIFIGMLLMSNAACMNQFYYHSYIAYQKDQAIANEIMFDIQKMGLDYQTMPIVFIGKINPDPLPVVTSSTMGTSFFSWDQGRNRRIHNFLRLQGYAVVRTNVEQRQLAYDNREGMTCWPQDGSIKVVDGIIIVYLSEPNETWKELNLKEADLERYERLNGIQGYIDP